MLTAVTSLDRLPRGLAPEWVQMMAGDDGGMVVLAIIVAITF